jgi:hypothetical protein
MAKQRVGDPYERLARKALWQALVDAADARDVAQSAGARFWLLFGSGAYLADLLGCDAALAHYLGRLDPLPGQNGGPVALELSRLADGGRGPGL